MKNSEGSLNIAYDTIKVTNIRIILVPEEKKKAESYLKKKCLRTYQIY